MEPKKNTNAYDHLLLRYPENEYCLLSEVRNSAGFSATNSADFLAVGYWPSRGCPVIGFELKSSRSDWLRELKNAKKAEAIFQYCNEFYLITDNEKVAFLEEIPPTWGWLDCSSGKLRTLKAAPAIEPIPLTKGFIVAMLKRATDKKGWIHQSQIQDKIDAAVERGQEYSKQAIEHIRNDLKRTIDQIKAFEDTSGVKLAGYYDDFGNRRIGEAVKFVLKHGTTDQIRKELLDISNRAKAIADRVEEGLKAFNQ